MHSSWKNSFDQLFKERSVKTAEEEFQWASHDLANSGIVPGRWDDVEFIVFFHKLFQSISYVGSLRCVIYYQWRRCWNYFRECWILLYVMLMHYHENLHDVSRRCLEPENGMSSKPNVQFLCLCFVILTGIVTRRIPSSARGPTYYREIRVLLSSLCNYIDLKMQRTIVIRRDYLHYIRKYNRFEKRHRNMSVHLSPCFRYFVLPVVNLRLNAILRVFMLRLYVFYMNGQK
jgi:hypothetical protein